MKSFSNFVERHAITGKKITMTLSIIVFVVSSLNAAQVNTNPQTFTISGNVGVAGASMRGTPGIMVSSGLDGSYSITVPSGWSGKIAPQKEGYDFSPATITYSSVLSDLTNQDYAANVKTFTISGTTGIPGVEMLGLPGNFVTGPDGSYTVTLEYGFAGTVKPVKKGYDFSPSERRYTKISNNFTNQDYKAALNVYTISGTTGVAGVRMNGLPGNPVTDRNGSYRINLPYGWTGTVTPEKRGYTFNPANYTYSSIIGDNNQNYDAVIIKYEVSGTIVSDKGEPMEGVLFDWENIPVVTDAKGRYSIEVEYGWTGALRPEKEGYIFSPEFIQYSPVNRDVANENFKAQIRMLTISDTLKFKDTPIQGVKITANPGDIKTVTNSQGQYSIQVPYGWSGDITLSKPGIMIDPPSKSYTNVTTDIINGIPVPPTNLMGAAMAQTGSWSKTSGPVGRRILVVPSGEIDSKDIAETKEDILVMAEILDERFREPRLIEGVLRDFGDFFGRDNQQTEAISIQGYGLVFMMEVNYQFSSLSQPDEEVETQANSDTDQTWEQARQRLLSRGAGTQASAGEYEKQMVEILKTELIRTLKYALNIRNIKPDDWVILSVSGVNRQSMPLMGAGSFNSYSGGGEYGVGGSYGYGGGGFRSYSSDGNIIIGGYEYDNYGSQNNTIRSNRTVSPTASVMTIRVKKSDVDEFANDKIDLEQFRQKVQILLY